MKLIKSDIAKLVTFDEKLEVGEDALYNLEVADKISEAAILEKPLYNYYATSNSVVKRWDKNYIKKYQKAVEQIKAYMEEKYGNKYALEVENFVTYHAFLILVNFCCHNKNKDRLGSLKRLMKIRFLETRLIILASTISPLLAVLRSIVWSEDFIVFVSLSAVFANLC